MFQLLKKNFFNFVFLIVTNMTLTKYEPLYMFYCELKLLSLKRWDAWSGLASHVNLLHLDLPDTISHVVILQSQTENTWMEYLWLHTHRQVWGKKYIYIYFGVGQKFHIFPEGETVFRGDFYPVGSRHIISLLLTLSVLRLRFIMLLNTNKPSISYSPPWDLCSSERKRGYTDRRFHVLGVCSNWMKAAKNIVKEQNIPKERCQRGALRLL